MARLTRNQGNNNNTQDNHWMDNLQWWPASADGSILKEDSFATIAEPISTNDVDKVPYSFVLIGNVKGHKIEKPFLCLFDTGSTSTWIK